MMNFVIKMMNFVIKQAAPVDEMRQTVLTVETTPPV